MSGLLPLLKLIVDSGAVSPKAPTEVTPPSSDAGFRPDCGLGSKAILIQPDDTGKNDYWVCVPSFK
jgi:hypothetical protein|tara:strand:- start:30 stop:227 length:198 start_codon:yes stop_codon:yes gene_type:complete